MPRFFQPQQWGFVYLFQGTTDQHQQGLIVFGDFVLTFQSLIQHVDVDTVFGEITEYSYQYYKEKLTDVLPALGTHFPMTENELKKMFGSIPLSIFREHRWKEDLITLGIVPAEFVNQVSEGKVKYDWPAQVNKLLVEGNFDLILSIGQVVPHEVVGMANYNKNIFVGTGGQEGINK
ncbi:MAG TPA: DUF2088 domain-containing protein, partial [Campylobacterales bacterium]|nr:DUF2088 domain-containing protein [Campylobacterales bacterium]